MYVLCTKTFRKIETVNKDFLFLNFRRQKCADLATNRFDEFWVSFDLFFVVVVEPFVYFHVVFNVKTRVRTLGSVVVIMN